MSTKSATPEVIHARHVESDGEQGGVQEREASDIVNGVMQQVLPMIEQGVKRALDGVRKAERKKPKYQRREQNFKNKGNKKRYEANEDIEEKIDEALESIGTKRLEEATEALNAGKKLLNKQQKLIKMADREEHGWDVVRYYVSDDLASDSDDEKAIKRARREALASVKKRNAERQKGKEMDEKPRNAPQRTTNYGERAGGSRSGFGNRSSTERRASTICYLCGREGHMQWACSSRYNRR